MTRRLRIALWLASLADLVAGLPKARKYFDPLTSERYLKSLLATREHERLWGVLEGDLADRIARTNRRFAERLVSASRDKHGAKTYQFKDSA